MTADNPVFAAAALALFLGCSWAMLRLSNMELPKGRLTSIDGLRGFLAASVFIHHSLIWRGYVLTGVWQAPDSNFYNQLGQSSVGLFFMITGFLFTRRLLEGNVDWLRLYAGRFARLAFAPTRRAALAAIACLLAALLLFHSAFRLPPLIFLTAFFAIVAGGNTLFGVLAWRPSRLLGEISFSVYLLHGLLLFALFRLILPAPQALSDTQHWLVAGGAIPLLVVVCLTTFRWVERRRSASRPSPSASR